MLTSASIRCLLPCVAALAFTFIQMAVEIYDWNPVPEDGGLVETGTWEQRTTQYDWVRTWELADEAVWPVDASPAADATSHFKPADHVLGDVHPYFHEGECFLYYAAASLKLPVTRR